MLQTEPSNKVDSVSRAPEVCLDMHNEWLVFLLSLCFDKNQCTCFCGVSSTFCFQNVQLFCITIILTALFELFMQIVISFYKKCFFCWLFFNALSLHLFC